jgi:1-acyl-sn-glycerol-3-phosphate acyltransferase
MKSFLHFLFRVLRYRVHAVGLEHLPAEGSYILAGNHESYFDPGAMKIAVFAKTGRDVFFLTQPAIARTWKKILGANAFETLGMLPIDTTDKSKVLFSAEEHLRRGGIVGIFPEGTRNRPSKNPEWKTTLLPAKTGTARLAFATGVPVIPVAVTAPGGIGIWQTIGNVLAFWKTTELRFEAPIHTTQHPAPTKEEVTAWTNTLMTRIASARGKRYPA